MNYEEFLKNYTPELQLIDAIDMLTHFEPDAAKILDQWASETNTEKNVLELDPTDPKPITFSQDIQLLSADWEPQYKSQGDSISISLNDNDEEQTLEFSCQGPDTYPVPYDVEIPSGLHLNTTID